MAKPVPRRVHRTESFAAIERDRDLRRLVIEIGEQLKLHDRLRSGAIGDPPPLAFAIGLELSIAQRVFEAAGVDRSTRDLHVDLNVDIGCSGVQLIARRAQEVWDKSSKHDELGSGAVVVHDSDQRALCGATGMSGTFFIGHERSPP